MYINVFTPTNYTYKDFNGCNNISFTSKLLTKSERLDIISKFEKKMETRTGNTKELYKYGIDYLNKKLDKQNFLFKMDELLKNKNHNPWGETDENEDRYIGNYGLFFDMVGPSAKKTTNSNIIDWLYSLIQS